MNRNLAKEIGILNHCIKEYLSNGVDPKKYLNITQYQILMYLLRHENENVIQKDLEAETHLKKASITGSLDTLAEMDLIYRVQAEDDKRKNYVKLTDKALKYKNDFENRALAFNHSVIKNISDEQLNTFYEVIDQIKKNITKEG